MYNGRAHNGKPAFTFSNADFNKLLTWPLYKEGTSEIPVDSIVSVGYTLGTYKGSTGLVLSSNIQFVIVLATLLSVTIFLLLPDTRFTNLCTPSPFICFTCICAATPSPSHMFYPLAQLSLTCPIYTLFTPLTCFITCAALVLCI